MYRELVAPERIVTTEAFEPFPEAEPLNTTALTEEAGITTLRTLVQHRSKEARDGHVDSGMEGGMQDTFGVHGAGCARTRTGLRPRLATLLSLT